MRFDKLKKQLELLILLSDGRNYTIEELCKRMELSRRNFYYLLDFIKHAGFIVFKNQGCYHIDRRSPFFTQLLQTIQFTDRDIKTIHSVLMMAGNDSEMVNQLRQKLENAYSLSVSADSPVRRQMDSNLKMLRKAMNEKRTVRLVGYSSPHSHTVKDRIVEPFLLLHDNQDVRCHELVSGANKTFKISRMTGVEMLDTPWLHEDSHRQVFTDIFMFSSEERHRVRLRLGQLSHNLFVEEYPQGAHYVTPNEDGSWLLDIEVCDYRGLGRFVLGLFKDIEVVEGDGFKAYMKDEINSLVSAPF
ncbi:helix-turn-helix transcriptional regulator [Prevotella fusca]|uniref:Transcriptional regulator n=1 Tax=Prevotella fusca JCM 17724 TaxID=1236517 RepID=A0A0K1NJH1_9BACT|nr:WYL domain-containing protein [Prevotella fusca]AKU69252.1 transcriptional regulator [Prevotella fusca JCM 17724]QUB86882.1 WYL domain-containing protein [Prevotella fusca JCM 17724]